MLTAAFLSGYLRIAQQKGRPFMAQAKATIRTTLASMLLVSIGSAFVGPNLAHAASPCRVDPVVSLSNGAVIDLNLAVNDSLSDVRHVSYTLHGPVGTSLISVSYPDGTGAISTVQYLADDKLGNYDGDTIVTTGTNVSMTAYLQVLALPTTGGTPTTAAPAQGHSGQDLHVHLHIA
jgi:hypothetical protein